ncbi:gp53-like domain-containing protein [Pelosinus baikalensis]|uniref:Putative tail fiber protein gp53-like C-terminal domain-containing protein n=1 Tax=Pelosinus baikalensis TaxID=2892015 RepID=A0ABS8HR22_9FIRM|nr:hypothetical protein [Pelosinus baikalensis]MCC5464567.1 hypothetical protein [Pelosinus baikalensis]
MSYNSSLPADTTAPEEIRENFRALKEDKIVAANTATTADSATTAESCTGNAATATKLATAVNINGVSFDGSEDITITAEAGYDDGHLLSTDGYQKLSNGLIFQWGSSNLPATGTTVAGKTVTFPIPFPSACLQAYATAAGSVNSASGYVPVMVCGTLTSASTTFSGDSNGTVKFTNTTKFNWFAIGY